MSADQSLKEAIQVLRAGDRVSARNILGELTRAEPLMADGWLWLAAAADDEEQKREHLRRALTLNPGDRRTVAALTALGETVDAVPASTPAPRARPRTSEPVAAAAPAPTPYEHSSPLAALRLKPTGTQAARTIPWRIVSLFAVLLLLIPMTVWLV